MSAKLSEPQLRALKEAEAGRVIYDRIAGRYRSTVFPPTVRSDTIERLIPGLLHRPSYPGVVRETLRLTKRGREVLTNA